MFSLDSLKEEAQRLRKASAPPTKRPRDSDSTEPEERKSLDERRDERAHKMYAQIAALKRLPEEAKSVRPFSAGPSAPYSKNDEQEEETPESRARDFEVMRRLRALGEPIFLFGETARARRERLAGIEAEQHTEAGLRVVSVLEREQQVREERAAEEKAKKAAAAVDVIEEDSVVTAGLEDSDDPRALEDCAEERVLRRFRQLLKEWTVRVAKEPRASLAEKKALREAQTALGYLFGLLRKRSVPQDVVKHFEGIITCIDARDYVRATDEYLAIAIGNAPWPMGVTMVSIHDRAGRQRIMAENVAHILNDETTRKYLQSVKRLITFAQATYPTDPSHSVEWGGIKW